MTADKKIRVVLADDHAVLRAGLRALLSLEADMEVVGEAGNGREAMELAQSLTPDVIVMDISMPEVDGLAAARGIHEMELPCHIVILTVHAEEDYLFQTLQMGASGYVLKSSADRELMDAIRAAHRGEVFLYPSAVKKVLGEYLKGARGEGAKREYEALTSREKEVLKLTAEGFTNQEIAEKLVISPKTVDTYRQRIMEKLNLHHRSELVRYALKTGLLTVSE
ncbi:MAG: DNA-binding response regulator [Chloroflexi bacterium RBG_16_64_32]|nr:MAG: DNA-binding response regulator [Chloroflexi bacterium RBG_16_64_32]